jgi:hypothetical protein
VEFVRRYHGTLDPAQLFASAVTAALISTEFLASSPTHFERGRVRQTYYGPTEILDPCYTPMIKVPARYESYFRPTRVTDADGGLHGDVADDLLLRAAA